jgi:Transcription factor involved in chromatin remodeling, contains bromodomain
MEDVIRNVRNNSYEESFEKFSSDIRRIYQNAILYNPPDSIIHEKAQLLKVKMYAIFHEFREKQLMAAIGAAKRSNGTLASLIRQKKQTQLQETLLPSRGTLLVVPHTLVEHWVVSYMSFCNGELGCHQNLSLSHFLPPTFDAKEQIHLHINYSIFCRKPALIYKHCRGRSYTKGSSHVETSDFRIFRELCYVRKSHFPFLFIDESTENLPSEELLASFLIVLTTTKVR